MSQSIQCGQRPQLAVQVQYCLVDNVSHKCNFVTTNLLLVNLMRNSKVSASVPHNSPTIKSITNRPESRTMKANSARRRHCRLSHSPFPSRRFHSSIGFDASRRCRARKLQIVPAIPKKERNLKFISHVEKRRASLRTCGHS